MIVGIFIVGPLGYFCSTHVDMDFGKNKSITAKGCFIKSNPPKELDMVDCLIKYKNAPATSFKACLRSINNANEIKLSMDSPLSEKDVKQLITTIAGFN